MLSRTLAENTTCTAFSVFRCNAGDDTMKELSRTLQTNKTLKYLSLANNKLPREGIMLLCNALKFNTTLQTLYLRATGINDKSIVSIADLVMCNTPLRVLHLGNNLVSDKGVEILLDRLKFNTNLHRLDLSKNCCSEAALEIVCQKIAANKVLLRERLEYMTNQSKRVKLGRWNKVKIMVVGQGRAGKTATIRSLLGKVFDEKLKSTVGVFVSKASVDLNINQNGNEIVKSSANWSRRDSLDNESSWFALNAALTAQIGEKRNSVHSEINRKKLPPEKALEMVRTRNNRKHKAVLIKTTAAKNENDDIEENLNEFLGVGIQSQSEIPKITTEMLVEAEANSLSKRVDLEIWDYGGQDCFYMLHELFLTNSGVILLMFDLVQIFEKEKEVLHYLKTWLNLIQYHNRNKSMSPPKVILVGTHADLLPTAFRRNSSIYSSSTLRTNYTKHKSVGTSIDSSTPTITLNRFELTKVTEESGEVQVVVTHANESQEDFAAGVNESEKTLSRVNRRRNSVLTKHTGKKFSLQSTLLGTGTGKSRPPKQIRRINALTKERQKQALRDNELNHPVTEAPTINQAQYHVNFSKDQLKHAKRYSANKSVQKMRQKKESDRVSLFRQGLTAVHTKVESFLNSLRQLSSGSRLEFEIIDNVNDNVCFFPVDNKSKDGIGALQNKIAEAVKDNETAKKVVPLNWIKCYDALKSEVRSYQPQSRKTRNATYICGKGCISLSGVIKVCESYGVNEKQEINKLLEFLHSLGLIWHFTVTQYLNEIVVVEPQKLLKAITRVIRDGALHKLNTELLVKAGLKEDYQRLLRSGIASFDILEALWTKDLVNFIVELLTNLLILSPFNNVNIILDIGLQSKSKTDLQRQSKVRAKSKEDINVTSVSKSSYYFIPSLLPKLHDNAVKIKLLEKIDALKSALHFCDFVFDDIGLPFGFFERLVCLCIDKVGRDSNIDMDAVTNQTTSEIVIFDDLARFNLNNKVFYLQKAANVVTLCVDSEEQAFPMLKQIRLMLSKISNDVLNSGISFAERFPYRNTKDEKTLSFKDAQTVKLYPWFSFEKITKTSRKARISNVEGQARSISVKEIVALDLHEFLDCLSSI